MVCFNAQVLFEEEIGAFFGICSSYIIFFLLIFDIFSLKRPKSEEFSFFRGGLVPETTVSPPPQFFLVPPLDTVMGKS